MIYRAMLASLSLLLIAPLTLAEADVDAADSLDFGAFHAPSAKTEQAETPSPIQLKVNRTPDRGNRRDAGYQVSEFYSLGNSVHTSYSAFSVIEALHIKMAKHCPNGWEKLHEWVERQPNSPVLRMNYHFRCLR